MHEFNYAEVQVNIVVVASTYPSPADPVRGVFVKRVVSAWCEVGHDVQVIAPEKIRRIGLTRRSGGQPRYLSFGDIEFGPFHTGRWSDRSFVFAASRAARESTVRQCDAVYAHFLYPAGFAAVRLRDRYFRGSKVVVAIGESSLSPYENRYGRANMRALASRIDGFVAVSEHLRDYLKNELGVCEKRIHLSPNAVDSSNFFPSNANLARDQLGIGGNKFVILYVGHLNHRKGYKRAIEAVAGMDDVHLYLAGGGGEREDFPENVTALGVVPPEQLSKWYNAADVFLLPTLAEGRCNAIEEAIACGVPVIAGDAPGVREQVVGRGGVVIDPMDIGEIRRVIREMIMIPAKRMALREEAVRSPRLTVMDRGLAISNWMKSLGRMGSDG